MINTYVKKPVTIKAIQISEKTEHEIYEWSHGAVFVSPLLSPNENNPSGVYWQVNTLEGIMTAEPGDYIIQGIKGEFYPCKPDVFLAAYAPINENKALHQALAKAMNGTLDNKLNIPDFILAEFVINCITALQKEKEAVKQWFGTEITLDNCAKAKKVLKTKTKGKEHDQTTGI